MNFIKNILIYLVVFAAFFVTFYLMFMKRDAKGDKMVGMYATRKVFPFVELSQDLEDMASING